MLLSNVVAGSHAVEACPILFPRIGFDVMFESSESWGSESIPSVTKFLCRDWLLILDSAGDTSGWTIPQTSEVLR